MIKQENHSNLPRLVLYSYWRSSAAWRVRIVLALKGIPYEYRPVNLLKGENRSDEYRRNVHPGGLVPALQVTLSTGESFTLTQSLAIIDYLDSMVPHSAPLLPQNPQLRAKALELAYTVACDTHPLQNLRILQSLPEGEERTCRAQQVISDGLNTFEQLLPALEGKSTHFCIGDKVTLADVVLVPQFYNANRWKCDLNLFPRCRAICEELAKLPAFIAAHPDNQPDTPTN